MATSDTPRPQSGTPTPAQVQKLATQEVTLDRIALIGISGTQGAPRALIRLPRGATETVTIGDRIGGATVQAIGEDRLILSRRGARTVMQMPQG
jgi:hypothetical protein